MSTLRKFIIACILILSILILWALLVQRAQIQLLPSNMYESQQRGQGGQGGPGGPASREAFTLTDANEDMPSRQVNELKLVTSTTVSPGIRNYNAFQSGNLPLQGFCIKASYNSACTGNYVTLDMVKYVLARGCRFLDFAVYHIDTHTPTLQSDPTIQQSRQPCVAFTDDPAGIVMKSRNYVRLTNVFQRLRDFAFQGPSPNPDDPLFIQLRIYSDEQECYDEVAQLIGQYFARTQYNAQGDKQLDPSKVLIQDLARSVVIVLDKNTVKEDTLKKSKLAHLVNIYSGGRKMLKYTPRQLNSMVTDPVMVSDLGSDHRTSVSRFIAVEPSDTAGVGAPVTGAAPATGIGAWLWSWFMPASGIGADLNNRYFAQNYGAQIVEFPFYATGDALVNYETFFADNGSALVPFYVAIPYLRKKSAGVL